MQTFLGEVYTSLVVCEQCNIISDIINPWHVREGYGSSSVCVCVSIITPAATYLCKQEAIRLFTAFSRYEFVENALFKSSSNIC